VRPEYNWQNPNQIGSMQKETYLSAMLQVYSEMFRVLKPNGLAIIIVKPFIRNKRVVDLPWHTWLLMAKAGFTLEKLYKLRLKTQSFWRILQYKKQPTLERIMHEYVIVAKKPTAA
jgi:DNA modification methylase